jgi:hypothetical protein
MGCTDRHLPSGIDGRAPAHHLVPSTGYNQPRRASLAEGGRLEVPGCGGIWQDLAPAGSSGQRTRSPRCLTIALVERQARALGSGAGRLSCLGRCCSMPDRFFSIERNSSIVMMPEERHERLHASGGDRVGRSPPIGGGHRFEVASEPKSSAGRGDTSSPTLPLLDSLPLLDLVSNNPYSMFVNV